MSNLTIFKIGGNVLDQPAALTAALDYFAALPPAAILVHGGGRRATELSGRLGIEARLVDGRRITDEATLETVTMVYAGLLNKQLVAALQARGRNAIGLSGADANVILAHKRRKGEIDYGFAGDIDVVNAGALRALLDAGLTPVCCPITHDGRGQLLNTNADTIASKLATALAGQYAVSLRYCFERPGVLRDPADDGSVIGHLNAESYATYRADGTISAGMIPKLDNAFAALEHGVSAVVIGNLESLRNGGGTTIEK